MELSLVTVLAIDFLVVCLLPFIFFKNGKFNLMWCMTAFPYVTSLAIVLANYFGKIPHIIQYSTAAGNLVTVIATTLAALSIALQFATMSTHRIPLALWHQEDDAPVNIVTWGPYSKVRHPFYTSFILALTANFIAIPSIPTLALLLYGVVMLTATAKREEARLSKSQYGDEYIAYMKKTGRFFKLL